ncbi:MAG: signal peptidase II [Tissierellia bacterium]|nr:signal peptidase II [Tissierellia bacterium]
MIYIIILIALIGLDQYTKFLAYENLRMNSNKVLIDKFLELAYVENRGAAFGILQGKSILFIIITLVVCFFIFSFFIKNYHTTGVVLKLSLVLMAAGAIGNLIDRIMRGFVVDFIFVRFWGYYDFPVFNIADICVVVGSILLVIVIIYTNELGE